MTSDDYIYTQVTNAVLAQYSTCHRSGKYEMVLEKTPAVYVVKVASERTYQGTDLSYSDKQHRVTYQVDVYTSGATAMTTAEDIMSLVENAFSTLYFRMTTCTPITGNDPLQYRMAARFERIICGNELTPSNGGTS